MMIQTNKILRITGWITIIILIIFVLAYSLNSIIKEKFSDFHKMEADSVDYIVLYKYSNINCCDSLILSKKQTDNFIHKWNNSYTVGPCKYLPSYTLRAKMKNGNNRNFRVRGKTIKENNDFGFTFLGDESFFNTIWNKK